MTSHFRLEGDDGVTVVTFVGPKIVPEVEMSLQSLFGAGIPGRLLLDLGAVNFLSSNALAILVGLWRDLDAAGGRMRVCGLTPELRELLRLTRLDKLFEIFDGRQDALRDF